MAAPVLRIARTRPEFDAITECLWDAFTTPPEAFWSVFEEGDLASRKAESLAQARLDIIAQSKDRVWDAHKKNSHSTWIYIADETQQGDVTKPRVLAACQWRVYKSPTIAYADGMPDVKTGAWPEGSVGGALADKFVRAMMTPRVMWMARPHVGTYFPCNMFFRTVSFPSRWKR